MNIASKVVYVTVGMIRKAVALCVMAQKYMPEGKRFGAIVWGQSGIGKNAVTDGLAEQFTGATGQKWGFVDCNVAGMTPEDITGLPQIDKNDITVDRPRYKFEADSYGIFRLDELDRPAYFQNLVAVAKFAIDRTVQHPLPLNWFVLGLANGASDCHTQELSEHLKGRFVHIYVSTNSTKARQEMESFFNASDMPEALKKLYSLNGLETRDEFEEHAIYNHRSLVYAGAILKAYEIMKENDSDFSDVLLPVLSGAIGRNAAVELMKLHDLQGLPTLDEVIANPHLVVIPSDLSLRHKYVTALVHEAQGDCPKAVGLLEYLVRLPDEVARYSIEILAIACPEVCKSAVYTKWYNRTR